MHRREPPLLLPDEFRERERWRRRAHIFFWIAGILFVAALVIAFAEEVVVLSNAFKAVQGESVNLLVASALIFLILGYLFRRG